MNEIGEFLAQLWRIFDELTVPGINITFAQLWLGCFVVTIAITILRPLLGIGAGAFRSTTSAARRAVSHKRAKKEDNHERSD